MNKQAKAYSLLLSIISPILGLVYGLKSLDKKGKRLILSVFGLFYGLLLNYSEGADAGTHARIAKTYYTLGLSDFIERLVGILIFHPLEDSPSDLYVHLLYGVCGSLFSSTTLFFMIAGTTYGYLYGGALLKVIDFSNKKENKIGALTFMLILLFIIHRSYDGMQTIRSWTGMWMLFNGVFGYHQTQKRKYLFMILFSPFFHLMYGFIAIPALLAIFFNFLHRYIFIVIYAISFIANINTLQVIDAASSNSLSEEKLRSYYKIDETGEDFDPIAHKLKRSEKVWYAEYGKTTSVYAGATAFIILVILGGFYNKNVMNNVEYGLMTTAILIGSLANFLSFAFTFYSRTMANASTYILAVMVLLSIRGIFKNKKGMSLKKTGVWIGIIIFIPKIVYFSSDIMFTASIMLLAMPFLKLFDTSLNFSIRDAIDIFR